MNKIFDKLKYFKPGEFRHPDKMGGFILLAIDAIREDVGLPFVITSDFRDGTSNHGTGAAVDGYFAKSGMPAVERLGLVQLAISALQLTDVIGMGIYTDWSMGILGFHFDHRRSPGRWSRNNGAGNGYDSFEAGVQKLIANPEKF